ncbi:hypothetical protein CHS0354_007562 [Potamilus streckersoni]|uniref:All-trans-retinol 13,14-reductase n=1 Tax=Potamilus streckersoni TaxID=2493646 RepID=A0AAE0T3Q5_9BIVA|nr:hypothetical protein CHS0354_007562 [Potamilus streckersoni]
MVLEKVFEYLWSYPSTLFLLCFFLYWLSLMFSWPKSGPNPFSTQWVEPPKELVTDPATRDKVLKQRFRLDKVPSNIDAIIIGSGIGGLTTAVLLARAGKKVLVLEQHDQAGGCCHTFVDKGFAFDTGIHYVGKMMEGNETRILVDQITEGKVVWVPMDEVYDTVVLGHPTKAKHFPMVAGKDKYIQTLEKLFPSEKESIHKFMQIMQDNKGAFTGVMAAKVMPKLLVRILAKTGIYGLMFSKYWKYHKKSVKQTLDDLTDNKEFKTVMSYLFGDAGPLPSQLSTLMYAALFNHYLPGAYYPLGGSSEIVYQIIPIIERCGGRVLVDAPVSKIILNKDGRAIGVCVHKSSGDCLIYAECVISDAGIHNTFKYLLPKEIAQKSALYHLIENVGVSISNLTVFVGLNGSTEELGLTAGNTWSYFDVDVERACANFLDLTLEEAAEAEVPLMFISFPSAKDPSWEKQYPGKSSALLITLCPYDWFTPWEKQKCQHRSEDYVDLKERIGKQMWLQCQQLFPKLEGKLEYMDVGTPLSNKHYLGAPKGEMYGLNNTLSRFSPEVSMELRPQTNIPGLYITGQDVVTCGFSGALFAGVFTAETVLHRNMMSDLTKLTKEVRTKIKRE